MDGKTKTKEENMELRVKGVRTFASPDGGGFNATLYVDNVKTAQIFNGGHGGCFSYHVLNKKKYEEFLAYVSYLPKVWMEGMMLTKDADWVVSDLVTECEERAWLKRQCKRKTLFLLDDEDAGKGYRTVKSPYHEGVKAFLMKKYNGRKIRILNEEVA